MKPPSSRGPGGQGPGGGSRGPGFRGPGGPKRPGGPRPPGGRPERAGGAEGPRGPRPERRDDRPRGPRPEGGRPERAGGADGPRGPRPERRDDRPRGPRPAGAEGRSDEARAERPRGPRPEARGDRPVRGPRPEGRGDRPQGGRDRGAGQGGRDRSQGQGQGGFRGRAPVGYEARRLAVDLVAGVQRGKLLDQLLDEGTLAARYQALDPRDRGLARAIVGVTLRRWGQIEDAIGRYLERPLPEKALHLKAVLAVGAGQILFMEVADHAAVALAVDLAGADKDAAPFKGLANAILRRVAAEKGLILRDQDPVALDTPAWLLERWTETYGAETARAIAASHLVEPSLDLTVKSDPDGWAARLGGIVLPTGSVRVASSGAVEKLDGYDEGEWWVQDAAATLPVHLLGDVKGRKVADLCAAPGGKTAMLAHLGAKVTAVDVSWHRLARLTRNLHRLKLDADVVNTDITEWMAGPFDMILLDAPCTATGTLRRHPDGALSKTAEDIAKLTGLQRKLLDQAIRMLRPGGLLVYSVCSLEPEEGPDQIRRLMLIDAPVERVPVTADEVHGLAELVTPDGDVRTLPVHLPNPDPRLSGMDGFFAARLRRKV